LLHQGHPFPIWAGSGGTALQIPSSPQLPSATPGPHPPLQKAAQHTPSAGNSSASTSSSAAGTTTRARLALRAASFYRREAGWQGCLLAGGTSPGWVARWGGQIAAALHRPWLGALGNFGDFPPGQPTLQLPGQSPRCAADKDSPSGRCRPSHLQRTLGVQCIGALTGLRLCLGLTFELE
jgi:hypothetical protein